jgi:hypothetical protein
LCGEVAVRVREVEPVTFVSHFEAEHRRTKRIMTSRTS